MTESKDLVAQETEMQTVQSTLVSLALRDDIDPDKLEKLLELQIRMEDRQAERDYNGAYSGFQAECPVIVKTSGVSFGKTDFAYAALGEIAAIIKPLLGKYNLSYAFDTEHKGDISVMTTVITHASGHSKVFKYYFGTIHDDERMNIAQRRKSAVTYAKRASLENALGIVTDGEDDDARRAIDNPATDKQIDEINTLLECLSKDKDNFLVYFSRLACREISKMEEATSKECSQALVQLRDMKRRLDENDK